MIRDSGTRQENPGCHDWTDAPLGPETEGTYADHGNLRFFRDVLRKPGDESVGHGGAMAVGLVGRRDLPGVTLRRAQSVLRWDLRPSLWSQAFLLRGAQSAEDLGEGDLREVSLYSPTGAFPDPANNAVIDGTLRFYDDPTVNANACLVTVDIDEDELKAVTERAVEDPNRDRMRYDLWRMLGVWQSYLWSADALPNPLRQGHPVFSSAFVEYCYEAIQLDLAPGASERNSSPEHLWNAAKWWWESFKAFGHPIRCYSVIRDQGCAVLDREPDAPMFDREPGTP